MEQSNPTNHSPHERMDAWPTKPHAPTATPTPRSTTEPGSARTGASDESRSTSDTSTSSSAPADSTGFTTTPSKPSTRSTSTAAAADGSEVSDTSSEKKPNTVRLCPHCWHPHDVPHEEACPRYEPVQATEVQNLPTQNATPEDSYPAQTTGNTLPPNADSTQSVASRGLTNHSDTSTVPLRNTTTNNACPECGGPPDHKPHGEACRMNEWYHSGWQDCQARIERIIEGFDWCVHGPLCDGCDDCAVRDELLAEVRHG